MKKLILVLLLSGGCSYCEDCVTPADSNDPQDQAFVKEVRPVTDRACATAGCHGGEPQFTNAKAFKDGAAKARIENGTMPVPGSKEAKAFTAEDKALVLKYLTGAE